MWINIEKSTQWFYLNYPKLYDLKIGIENRLHILQHLCQLNWA